MRPQGIDDQGRERLEQLLRTAADFEPDEPAPVGLAFSAMTRWEARQRETERRRPAQRAALFTLVLGGAGAAGATLAMAITQVVPGSKAPPVPLLPPDGPQQVLVPLSAPEAAGTTRLNARRAGGALLASNTPVSRPRAAVRRPSRSRVQWASRSQGRRAPLRPIWEEETVQRETAKVGRSGWLIQQGPEPDTWVLTPGRVEVTVPATNPAGSERSESAEISVLACDGTPVEFSEEPKP